MKRAGTLGGTRLLLIVIAAWTWVAAAYRLPLAVPPAWLASTFTTPAETAESVLPVMVAHVGHAEVASIEKVTGFPEAPPVADSVIAWPACSVVGGLKPVMVCGIIDDTVAAPLRLTLNVAAGVAISIIAVPAWGPSGVATGGGKVAGNWEEIPGGPEGPREQPLLAAGTRVNMVLVGSVTSGVAKAAARLPSLSRVTFRELVTPSET